MGGLAVLSYYIGILETIAVVTGATTVFVYVYSPKLG